MSSPIFNNIELENSFQKNGFIKVPFLSNPELESLILEFKTLKPDDGFKKNTTEGNTFHSTSLDTNLKYKKQVHSIITTVFKKKLDTLLSEYKILATNCFVKPPKKGDLNVHQNWRILEDFHATSLSVWVPLQDTNERNGTLYFIPKSHKIIDYFELVDTPSYFQNFNTLLIKKHLKPISVTAGEALIFCDSLIHWSSRNISNQNRIALHSICIPKNIQPLLFVYDDKEPEILEKFPVDSSFFLNQTIHTIVGKPKGIKSKGFIKNPNKSINYDTFKKLYLKKNSRNYCDYLKKRIFKNDF